MAQGVGRSIWVFIRNTFLIVIGLLIVWGLGAYILYQFQQWKEADVLVKLKHKGRCTEGPFPLEIMIENNSKSTINKTNFKISARNPGFSTDVVSGGYQDWDAIIKPGEARGTCWGYPRLSDEGYSDPPNPSRYKKEDLEWSVERTGVDFAD